ncbi:glycosyltransferase [Candidatus Woesearchaeota archaeon]|nr:glycosyltransferase [Candidatus Woesearchaeota archaeon]
MKKKIALVLPAFNEEKGIASSLLNIRAGICEFPQHDFKLFPIDDASSDNTYEAIQHWGRVYELKLRPFKNQQNMGVAQSLKKMYKIIAKTDVDFIIKTDLDSDFNQRIVLEELVPYCDTDEKIVAGVRWREITPEENAYEVERRNDILKILEEELGVTELDPPSVGSQFYSRGHLETLLEQPMVQAYDKRWGFELLLDLVSAKIGVKAPVVRIEKGQYDPARRPPEKVDGQYNAYIEIVAALIGKAPQELSKLYNK